MAMNETDAFATGKRDIAAEYAAIRKAGYTSRAIATMAQSDLAEYERDIAACSDDFHRAFLEGLSLIHI